MVREDLIYSVHPEPVEGFFYKIKKHFNGLNVTGGNPGGTNGLINQTFQSVG